MEPKDYSKQRADLSERQRHELTKTSLRALLLSTVVVLAAACGASEVSSSNEASGAPTSTEDAVNDNSEVAPGPTSVGNNGGAIEGHTPRGFAGSGTGLFLGDNLNSGFPDGDGLQLFLTFDVPSGTPTPESAVLRSDLMSVSGSPFEDLGELTIEPVEYESFGPPLFDLEAAGPAAVCSRTGDSSLECDVTSTVIGALDAGATRLQFRMKFDTPGDNDGAQDLLLFFRTDSNTNEPGIFTLDLD